jgi:predicted Zn-dependent peptidase
VWLLLRPLAYTNHPYKWATIGKEIKHIEEATMDDVKAFFFQHYRPNNAVLSVAGDVSVEQVKLLAEKWFGDIPAGKHEPRNLPKEPKQLQARSLTVERDVPSDAIYMTFHICDRLDPNYYAIDLASDILSRGDSSRLFESLIKEQGLCSNVNAYITGDMDEGLFVISATANDGVTLDQLEAAILDQIQLLIADGVTKEELQKVKNKVESAQAFGNTSVLNKAMGLAIAELIEDASLVNKEMELYQSVTAAQIQDYCHQVLIPTNCSTLYYKSTNK